MVLGKPFLVSFSKIVLPCLIIDMVTMRSFDVFHSIFLFDLRTKAFTKWNLEMMFMVLIFKRVTQGSYGDDYDVHYYS